MRTLVILLLSITLYACGTEQAASEETSPTSLPYNGEFTKLSSEDIPAFMQLDGTLLQAITYEDILGKHHFIAYQLGPLADPRAEDALMASLQLALYRNEKVQPVWAYSVAESNCPFDLWVGVDTLSVTDLDKNGMAELGVVLSHSCRSDVSPARMQVLLFQQDQTYRLSGDHWLPMFGAFPTPDSYAMSSLKDSTAYEIQHDMPARWGRFRVEEAPTALAGVLREHARRLWRSQVVEKEFRSLSIDD